MAQILAGTWDNTKNFDPLIKSVTDAANLLLSKNQAQIGSQFGNMGLGRSSREAIASGTAQGEAATGVANVLAPLEFQARQQDLDRKLSAMVANGQITMEERQLALQANEQQFNQGQSLLTQENADQTGVTTFINELMQFLFGAGTQTQAGTSVTH